MIKVPHYSTIVAFCIAAVGGYALLSWYIMVCTSDAALKGDVVGTWKSFAVLAFGFWIGSSSGGKSRDAAQEPPAPTALPEGDKP